MARRKPHIVCKLEFIAKFNVVVPFQNLENIYIFKFIYMSF